MSAAVRILFRDERLLVVDKPAGITSVPELVELLRAEGTKAQAVHRLDREVSGAIVLALDGGTREALERAFRERRVSKTYWALVSGHPEPREGTWSFPILEEGSHARVSALGAKAQTRFRTLARHATTAELEIELVTGRRNQIRVHFAHAGHPLVGERKYARGKESPLRLRSRRVALHSAKLAFEHPSLGTRLEIEAPLPADLEALRASAASERRRP